ncbi:MAG: menaquinone biosynthesis decarboxylase [Chlamydiae bacterium]|nr:menaquinone biosynthesis decarboxylase [Chlamydiota bacterium]MBI3276450.1 menaquinone biosynthesis decarboxylase [Chlamydiota bacterium]
MYTYDSLNDFVQALEKIGELKRISYEVDPVLEITEITDRVTKQGGPALLFEKVKGSSIPLLINTFGSAKRMSLSLGAQNLEELAERISSFLEPKIPSGFLESVQMLPMLQTLRALKPKLIKQAPCQEIVKKEGFSLFDLPALQCWPKDGGRYITLPVVITKDPETGTKNYGIYRLQIFDERSIGMHWQIHKGGAAHFHKAKSLGKRLEVAVSLGPDPAVIYSASAPLPEGVDEMMLAGFIRNRPVEMVSCKTIDSEVPANSQIILEGYVNPTESKTEGPFGDHTGYYSLADLYPVFHVTAITMRKNPIYPTIIVGPPLQEDFFMGKATERIFLPLLKKQLPELIDMNMPAEGIFHNLLIVSIDKRYPGQARKVMSAIWGLAQLCFAKVVVVVDKDVDVHNLREVAWKALNHIDPERDFLFTTGPVDVLDHASRLPCLGSKVGIDATRKWKEEGFTRDWPDEIVMDAQVKERVTQMWNKFGL